MKIKIEIDEGLPEDEVLIRWQGTDGTDFGCAEGGERSDQHLAEIRLLQRKYRVLPDLG